MWYYYTVPAVVIAAVIPVALSIRRRRKINKRRRAADEAHKRTEAERLRREEEKKQKEEEKRRTQSYRAFIDSVAYVKVLGMRMAEDTSSGDEPSWNSSCYALLLTMKDGSQQVYETDSKGIHDFERLIRA